LRYVFGSGTWLVDNIIWKLIYMMHVVGAYHMTTNSYHSLKKHLFISVGEVYVALEEAKHRGNIIPFNGRQITLLYTK
jgi:hypothetical protein